MRSPPEKNNNNFELDLFKPPFLDSSTIFFGLADI